MVGGTGNRSFVPRAWIGLCALALCAACSYSSGFTTTIVESSSGDALDGSPEAVLPTIRCGDFFVAKTMLNGEGPFRLILDTGFPRTQLAPESARALGVRRSLRSIEVGDFHARGRIPIGVTEMTDISRALGMRVDGILGYTAFAGVLLVYDFPADAVLVREAEVQAHADGVVAMATGDRPYVRARLGQRTIDLLLDTGFDGGIALLDFDELEFVNDARPVGARVRADGISIRWAGRVAEDLILDAFTIRRPVVTQAVRRDLIGQDVLRRFVLTLDRANGRARFEAADGRATMPLDMPPLHGSGLALVPRADHFEVARVFEPSPGAQAGVRPGDRIIAINGVPVPDRACPAPDGADATRPRRLTIMRDGVRFDTVVQPSALVP